MKTIYKYISLLFCIGISTCIALAQTVTNVRAQQEGEQIIITYDLSETASVSVYVATGQSNQYTELKAVTGNIGKGVQPGTNLRITWTPLNESTEFVAQNVRFRVSAMPNVPFFWVSPTKAVIFSPGNLQYRASTNTWRFAPHQWEYIGEANKNISKTYDGWIDLFGWGTGDNPTKSSTDDNYPTFVDWGVNTIGTYRPNTWRTLTHEEWTYLFQYTRWTIAKVNGALGFILLPDEFSIPASLTIRMLGSGNMHSSYLSFNETDYVSNQYTAKEFTPLEANGCVFLPCAGYGGSSGVIDVGFGGGYWSATPYDEISARGLCFSSSYAYADNWNGRGGGQSVRLVQDLK